MCDGIRCLVLPIAEVLHHEFKDAYFENFKGTLVFQFILILMKIMFKEAVLDEYFDDRAYLQVEPGNTGFIHGYAKRTRTYEMALDFTEKIVTESESTSLDEICYESFIGF